ncbi:MAG TPA: carboxypeptidase-like regulatory domain-containing protein [Chitinispirillaceae bacterium]|nr:carboxypeptidase-like regulatory domain-containing protein [Chitinispirillaceae bacterium]
MKKSVILIFVWLFLTCVSNIGTDTGNVNCGGTNDETVVRTGAIIYEQDGTTPAVGAVVKVFKPDATDGQIISYQITDLDGRYVLNDLPPGIFNILVEKDSMVAYRDSINISATEQAIPDDTLDCSSSLSGYTTLQPLYDPRSVTIQVIGTDRSVNEVDSNGHFILTGMPGGKFTLLLKCKHTEYPASAQKVTVHNCTNDTLTDTIRINDTLLMSWASALRSSDRFLRDPASRYSSINNIQLYEISEELPQAGQSDNAFSEIRLLKHSSLFSIP